MAQLGSPNWTGPNSLLLDWNKPHLTSELAAGVEYGAYQRALISVRTAISGLPPRPQPKNPRMLPPDETGLDIQIFIALTEVAQGAGLHFAAPEPAPSVDLMLAGTTLTIHRPLDTDLPAHAAATAALATKRVALAEEILAQNVEPDRFMLDAVGLSLANFPFTHSLIRTTILAANVFCLRIKHWMAVQRPTRVNDPRTNELVIPLPALLPVPAHASFPGGHALQCGAAATVLNGLLHARVDSTVPFEKSSALMALAHRIGVNREVAGLHYAIDTTIGLKVGDWFAKAFELLAVSGNARVLEHLFQEARNEMK